VTEFKIEDILQMLKDRRDYINTWEKETGKILNDSSYLKKLSISEVQKWPKWQN
jgi:hypothetical protein